MARRCIAGPRLGSSTRARVREKLSRMSQKKNGEREAELPNRFDTRETAARRPHSHSAQAIRRGQRERRSEGEAHRAPGPAPTRPGAARGACCGALCGVWATPVATRPPGTSATCTSVRLSGQRLQARRGGRRAWRVAWPPRPSTGRSSSTEPHSQRGARERNSWPNTIPGRPIPPLSPHRTASKVYLDQLISEASCAGAWCTRYTLTNPASRPRGSPPRRH